jgi:hypothetical protein
VPKRTPEKALVRMSQPIARFRNCVDRAPRLALPTAASDRAIADFLAGRSDGEWLLHTLFDAAADEPLPPRLRKAVDSAG